MFAKFIPRNIQEKLKAKERALDWKNNAAEGELTPKDIMSRSVFVRMCSNKDKVDNILISGGEVGSDGELQFGRDIYKKSGGDKGRPIAGIKDISVEYKGGYKALRQATINWTIFSIQDLDRLTPYFLTIGKTVVLDWGWTTSKRQSLSLEYGSEPFITKNSDNKFIVNQNIFSNPQELIQKKGGDYDAIGGQVVNFEYNLRQDGGFDCVTKITSLGADLLNLPVDTGGNTLTSVTTDDDNKIITAPDGLVNAMINLRGIIIHDIFNVPYRPQGGDASSTSNAAVGFFKKYFGEEEPKNIDQKLTAAMQIITEGVKMGVSIGDVSSPTFNVYTDNAAGLKCINVDDKNNPNIIHTYRDTQEDIYVTWGWMEDQLLNRYVSFTGGEDNSTKLTIRSIDTILHTEGPRTGQPITRDEYDNEISPNLTADQIFEKYGVEHTEVKTEIKNPTSVLKRSTTIKNYPNCWPRNPSRFFVLGENYKPVGIKTNLYLNSLEDQMESQEAKGDEGLHKSFLALSYFDAALGTIGDVEQKVLKSKKFNKDGDDKGMLRNVWINIKEIQKAFGIRKPENTADTSISNVNPTGTLERCLNNLLRELNENFHNAWEFEIVLDPYDSTNLKVIDIGKSVNNPNYTNFKDDSKEIQDVGIYSFPAFTNSSMVKSQELSFKIPNAQAITTLYGSNAKKKEKTSKGNLNNSKLTKLFKGDNLDSFSDRYLNDLESSNIKHLTAESSTPSKASKVGSYRTKPNEKISTINGDLAIQPYSPWWKKWSPNTKKTDSVISNSTGDPFQAKKYVIEMSDSTPPKPMVYYYVETSNDGQPTGEFRRDTKDVPMYYTYNNITGFTMNSDLALAINSHINDSSPTAAFVRDSVIPADLSLNIDGMGGLTPGDLMHTDYIQNKYKSVISIRKEGEEAKEHGPAFYFQIWGHTQTVSPEGWTTQLQTKMRYNSIPHIGEITYQESDFAIAESKNKKIDVSLLYSSNPERKVTRDYGEVDLKANVDSDQQTDITMPPTELLNRSYVDLKLKEKRELREIMKDFGPPIEIDENYFPNEIMRNLGQNVASSYTDFNPDGNVTSPTILQDQAAVNTQEIKEDEPGISRFPSVLGKYAMSSAGPTGLADAERATTIFGIQGGRLNRSPSLNQGPVIPYNVEVQVVTEINTEGDLSDTKTKDMGINKVSDDQLINPAKILEKVKLAKDPVPKIIIKKDELSPPIDEARIKEQDALYSKLVNLGQISVAKNFTIGRKSSKQIQQRLIPKVRKQAMKLLTTDTLDVTLSSGTVSLNMVGELRYENINGQGMNKRAKVLGTFEYKDNRDAGWYIEYGEILGKT